MMVPAASLLDSVELAVSLTGQRGDHDTGKHDDAAHTEEMSDLHDVAS